MNISERLIDLIIEKNRFEYNGCHSPDPNDPLYGRAAYWRAFTPTGMYVCKITTPVNVMEPRPKTLKRLLREELTRRFEKCGERLRHDEYGKVEIWNADPSHVRPLLDSVLGLLCLPNRDSTKGRYEIDRPNFFIEEVMNKEPA